MMKKIYFILTFTLCAAVLLSACGSPEEAHIPENPDPDNVYTIDAGMSSMQGGNTRISFNGTQTLFDNNDSLSFFSLDPQDDNKPFYTTYISGTARSTFQSATSGSSMLAANYFTAPSNYIFVYPRKVSGLTAVAGSAENQRMVRGMEILQNQYYYDDNSLKQTPMIGTVENELLLGAAFTLNHVTSVLRIPVTVDQTSEKGSFTITKVVVQSTNSSEKMSGILQVDPYALSNAGGGISSYGVQTYPTVTVDTRLNPTSKRPEPIEVAVDKETTAYFNFMVKPGTYEGFQITFTIFGEDNIVKTRSTSVAFDRGEIHELEPVKLSVKVPVENIYEISSLTLGLNEDTSEQEEEESAAITGVNVQGTSVGTINFVYSNTTYHDDLGGGVYGFSISKGTNYISGGYIKNTQAFPSKITRVIYNYAAANPNTSYFEFSKDGVNWNYALQIPDDTVNDEISIYPDDRSVDYRYVKMTSSMHAGGSPSVARYYKVCVDAADE